MLSSNFPDLSKRINYDVKLSSLCSNINKKPIRHPVSQDVRRTPTQKFIKDNKKVKYTGTGKISREPDKN